MPETKTEPAEKPESFGQREPDMPVNNRCESFRSGKENVNFDFQEQDIVPILRLFADISGCNIFIHPDVKGKATMKFRDVPWDQAFDTLLKTFSLGQRIEGGRSVEGQYVEGNIIRVAPLSIFAKESDEKVKAQQASEKAEPLETKMFPISYAEVGIVENAIKNSKILSPRGSISVDKRTSSMLVKDIASVFPEIENLLITLDRPTPQVLIEARIVEVNTATTRDLGIQWGLNIEGIKYPEPVRRSCPECRIRAQANFPAETISWIFRQKAYRRYPDQDLPSASSILQEQWRLTFSSRPSRQPETAKSSLIPRYSRLIMERQRSCRARAYRYEN